MYCVAMLISGQKQAESQHGRVLRQRLSAYPPNVALARLQWPTFARGCAIVPRRQCFCPDRLGLRASSVRVDRSGIAPFTSCSP
jgi:hypothetical protein